MAWLGHYHAWLLLGSVWIALGLLSALALGLVARVGKGMGRK